MDTSLSPFDRNTPYNDLPLLPPPTDIENNPVIFKKLISASRALASVNGSILRLPNPYMLVNTIALQEAKSSTEIENIFTTEDELYKAISDSVPTEKTNAATKEVLRYREALWAGYHSIIENKVIDVSAIIKIFQQIKDTTGSLRPPQSMVVIKRGQSEFRPGEIIYTPPRGDEVISRLMQNLVDYLNDDTKYSADPLIKMCIAHYQFEAIHPFQDGNGRTGRILNLLYLINKGLLNQPVLYLSKYIIRTKEDYYFKLGAVTQRMQWHDWILYMLDAVEKTSILTNQLINDILQQMDATLDYAKSKIKWYSKEINEIIFSQPYLKPRSINGILTKSSRTTITKYMAELQDAGILTPKKDSKEVFYLNNDLIRILQDH
jgi:Fic family protein